ncbi:response regulator [Vibrio panuliri]|uniref:histidine kinase n=1 Tax=Vibrio panuliri TaxID=1381081 RepID=A0ABX3FI93_9VIBR|nr:response regulator [Vibrio panuliri]OLQ93625.1 diguanylate cyclase [Vibrio panuliri]
MLWLGRRATKIQSKARIQWISVIVAFMLLMCSVSSGSSANEFEANPSSLRGDLTQDQVKNIAVELKYLDEVLTSSILSYAFSADEKWRDRYLDAETRLTALIGALLASQDSSDWPVIRELETAHFELVAIEMRVIDSVRANRLDQAMAQINGTEYHLHKERYMTALMALAKRIEQRVADRRQQNPLNLTQIEQQWLQENVVRVGVEDWPPMLYVDSEGELAGVSGDIVKQIALDTGMKIEIVTGSWRNLLSLFKKGQIDLLPHAYKNEARKTYGDFSTPYFLIRELYFVPDERSDLTRVADLTDATIAISAGYTTIDKIKDLYPNVQVLETAGIEEAITAVLDGRADAVLDAEMVVLNWLAEHKISGLRAIDEDVLSPSALHLWSNSQASELHSIVQKGLDSLDLRGVILSKNDWAQAVTPVLPAKTPLNLVESLKYVIVVAVILTAVLMLLISRVFKINDKLLAAKFGNKSFKRSMLAVQVVLCGVLIATALIVTRYAERKSVESINHNLSTVLESAHKRIGDWVDLELNSLSQLGKNPQLVAMVEQLLTVERKPSTLVSSPIQQQIREFIESRTGIAGSFGYFIISPDHISVSSRRDTNIGTVNLIERQRPDLMASALNGRRVFVPPIQSDVTLQDDGETNPPTMFFAVPVINADGKTIAVLTKRVDFQGFFSNVLSAGFIGKSGETYAIDKSGLLLSNVRFEQQLKQIGLLGEQQRSSLNIRVADPGIDLSSEPQAADPTWPLTLMAQSISERNSGRNLQGYNDYRGVPVVGKWVWDDVLNIGITAEMDVAEAYSLLSTFKMTVWSMLTVALVLMLGTSVFTMRVGTRATAALARTQVELERQVKQRTIELQIHSERTRNIIDHASDGIIVVDSQGTIVEFSPAAESIFGYRAAEVLSNGSVIDSMISPPFHRYYQQNTPNSLSQHNLVGEFVGYSNTGDAVDLEISVSESELAGKVLYTAIVRDVTERKVAERELKLAKKKAEEATQAKSDFLANMSHEIRTPMNAIIGMSYLAMRTKLDPQQADYVGKIQVSAENLLGIINDILDFSKIEAGKLDLEKTDFDLQMSVDNLVQLVAHKCQEKGLELLIDLDPDLPTQLVGDPLRLGQVLLNLTNNAVKFTEQGEIVVKAELVSIVDKQVLAQFTVRDTGIGMTQEQISRLFQSFSQADASTTRKYGGTGLGLTISRTLVELMEGEIWVTSETGSGSSFCFTAQFERSNQKSEPLKAARKLSNISVLIVDDSDTAREILHTLCHTLKIDAALASSAEEALEKITFAQQQSRPFDVVLTDWKMPNMDGLELACQVAQNKALTAKPYMILVTAYDKDELIRQAGSTKIDACLTKPVSASTLLDTLLSVITKDHAVSQRVICDKIDLNIAPEIAGAKVLLVEDNAINQQIATELLHLIGVEVVTANNGQEAVERVMSETFDIVLMDVQMPVMDGYQATIKIRETYDQQSLPIIAMTANAMAGDREKCLTAGMNEHLSKPINPNQVFQALANWIKPTGVVSDAPRLMEYIATEPTTELRIEGFDTASALARMGGNVAAYKKTLANVAASEADVVQRVVHAVANGEIQLAVIAAHSLKGIAGNIGAVDLVKPAEQLEHALALQQQQRRCEIGAGEQELLNQIDQRVCQMIAAIQVALAEDAQPVSQEGVDDVLCQQLIERLYVQMDDFDSAAVETFDQLLASSNGKFDSALAAQASQALNNYDFESAVPLIKQATLRFNHQDKEKV